MRPNEAPMEGAMAVLTTPATEVADDLVTPADGRGDASARFVQTAEAVAAGIGADHAIAILCVERESSSRSKVQLEAFGARGHGL